MAVSEGHDLVGLFLLCTSRTPWKALRPMGIGPSDILKPLLRPGCEHALEAIVGALEEVSCDLIDLQQIRENDPLVELLPGFERDEQALCPVLQLPPTFEEYLKTLGKSLRYDVNKGLKAELRVEDSHDEDSALRNLDVFLELHARRWRKRGLPGAFGLPKVKRFQQDFVRRAGAEGMLRLQTLWQEGQPIGALYAMQAGNGTFFYQSGFDPGAGKVSPGTILVARSIRRAIEEGCTNFDFLRGAEPYKMRWKPTLTVSNIRLMSRRTRVTGSVAAWCNQVEARLEAKLRKRLEGKGLIN